MADEPIKADTAIRKTAIVQSVSVAVFLGGFGWFLYGLGEMFTHHSEWSYFKTPMAVGEMLQLGGSAATCIAGALGVNVRDLFARKVTSLTTKEPTP